MSPLFEGLRAPQSLERQAQTRMRAVAEGPWLNNNKLGLSFPRRRESRQHGRIQTSWIPGPNRCLPEDDKKYMINGSIHPITQFLREAVLVFAELGFDVYEGPEVETEWYNFDALNIPADHPARDLQDTFWLKDKKVLRTHTSNGQVRYVETRKPPIRAVFPGTVFRNEATDAKHETTFTQLEGLYIDKDVKVGHLIWTLETFFKKIYGDETKIRLKPSFFPFVEPGFEVDVKHNGKWLELLGAGMVHPKVIQNMKLDPEIYSGFAFGLGIDRLVILKYGIDDIRLFRSGDLRFLKQF